MSVSCMPAARQDVLAPWPAAESLYVRMCDIPRTSESLSKVVRVRGIFWTDGVGSHSGFYDPTCGDERGKYLELYTSPDGDDSVVALSETIRNPPCPPHFVCGVRLQIDATGRIREGWDKNLGIDITHVHFSKLL